MEAHAQGPYEFGERENAVVGETATWVRYWSLIAIVGGVLMLIGGVFTLGSGGFVQLVLGAIYIFVGVTFKGSAAALRSVVETTGDDVGHLMTALDKLGTAFKVMVVAVAIGIALAVVAGVVAAMRGGVPS